MRERSRVHDPQADLFMPEEQMLLPLQARQDVQLGDLPARAFADVLSALRQLVAGELTQLHIWGPSGAGRTLLVNAFMADAGRSFARPLLLPLREVVFLSPDMLEGLESCDLIVLDDIEAVAGWADWEEALFNLYNRLQAQGGRLLVTAATPPSGLPLRLPDLCSRLARASVHALPVPDDDVRQELLQTIAARRAWQLDPDVARALLARGPRRLGGFMRLLDRLDAQALRERRPLTLPLLRSLLPDVG